MRYSEFTEKLHGDYELGKVWNKALIGYLKYIPEFTRDNDKTTKKTARLESFELRWKSWSYTTLSSGDK